MRVAEPEYTSERGERREGGANSAVSVPQCAYGARGGGGGSSWGESERERARARRKCSEYRRKHRKDHTEPTRRGRRRWYSVYYMLYWYKSRNTGAARRGRRQEDGGT